MADLKQILADPDYMGLPQEEKIKFWNAYDPDFAGLPPEEQNKFLGVIDPKPVEPESFGERFGQALWEDAKGFGQALIVEPLKEAFTDWHPIEGWKTREYGGLEETLQPIGAIWKSFITDPLEALGRQYTSEGPSAKYYKQGRYAEALMTAVPFLGYGLDQIGVAADEGDMAKALAHATSLVGTTYAGVKAAQVQAAIADKLMSKGWTYTQAKEFLRQLPKEKQEARFGKERALEGIQELGKEQGRDIVAQTKAELEQVRVPLRKERSGLEAQKRTLTATEDVTKTEGGIARQQLESLTKQEKDIGELQVRAQAYDEARRMRETPDTPLMDEYRMQQHTRTLREAQIKAEQQAIGTAYDEVRTIADRHKQPVRVGRNTATGEIIMEEQSTPVSGFKTPQLQKEYNRVKDELKIATGDDPAAQALIRIMEGKDAIPVEQMIDRIRSLNELGYGAGEGVTASQRLARMAGDAHRQALRRALSGLPGEDGKLAIAAYDKAIDLMRKSSERFFTKESKAAAKLLEDTGKATSLTDRPLLLRAWKETVDPDTFQLGKRQVIEDLVAQPDFDTFASKWKAMPDSSKELWFSREEIVNGNRIVAKGEGGLNDVAANYANKKAALSEAGQETSRQALQHRQQVRALEDQIRNVNAKLKDATEAAREKLTQRKAQLTDDLDRMRSRVKEDYRIKQEQLLNQEMAARELTAKRRRTTQALRYGLIGVGLWRAANVGESVMDALGWGGK